MIASEFGPARWTLENWLGVLIYVAAFLALVYLVYRISEPGVDGGDQEVD